MISSLPLCFIANNTASYNLKHMENYKRNHILETLYRTVKTLIKSGPKDLLFAGKLPLYLLIYRILSVMMGNKWL